MSQWQPDDFDEDPTVNALLNIAHGLHRNADATGQLLYALKYSQSEGMSIAESIEVGLRAIAEAVPAARDDIAVANSLDELAAAVQDVARAVAGGKPE